MRRINPAWLLMIIALLCILSACGTSQQTVNTFFYSQALTWNHPGASGVVKNMVIGNVTVTNNKYSVDDQETQVYIQVTLTQKGWDPVLSAGDEFTFPKSGTISVEVNVSNENEKSRQGFRNYVVAITVTRASLSVGIAKACGLPTDNIKTCPANGMPGEFSPVSIFYAEFLPIEPN